MRQHSQHAGFTLIELLIYTGILALLVVTVGSTLLAFSRTYQSIAAEQALEQGAESAMGTIVREVRSASSVDTTNSVLGSSPGTLALTTTDTSGTVESLSFSLGSGSVIEEMLNGTNVGPLTPSSVDVTSLTFWHIVTAHSEAVRIEMTLESGTTTSYRSRTFYDTAILRSTYVQ